MKKIKKIKKYTIFYLKYFYYYNELQNLKDELLVDWLLSGSKIKKVVLASIYYKDIYTAIIKKLNQSDDFDLNRLKRYYER